MGSGEACQNCGSALKDGAFTSNFAVSQDVIAAVNLAYGEQRTHGCSKCTGNQLIAVKDRLNQEIHGLRQRLLAACQHIPVVSIPVPPGWDFNAIGVVTSQSVTGTGMFSDVTSAFTDIFGAQSKAYGAKLKGGEDFCKAALQLRAVELGGDAVVGVDVDYAEVGGQRAMLMVCMTGTAVKLADADRIAPRLAEEGRSAADLNATLQLYERSFESVSRY